MSQPNIQIGDIFEAAHPNRTWYCLAATHEAMAEIWDSHPAASNRNWSGVLIGELDGLDYVELFTGYGRPWFVNKLENYVLNLKGVKDD